MNREDIDIEQIEDKDKLETIGYILENNLLLLSIHGNILPCDIKNIDDIFIWYDKDGPKKDLFERALHDKDLFYELYSNDKYHSLNPLTDNKYFIDFMLKNREYLVNGDNFTNLGYDLFINNELCKLKNIIFSKKNFEYVFEDNFYNIFNDISIDVKKYIETTKKVIGNISSLDSYFNFFNLNNINLYFDEKGPKDNYFMKLVSSYDIEIKNLDFFDISSKMKKFLEYYKKYNKLREFLTNNVNNIDTYFTDTSITEELCIQILLNDPSNGYHMDEVIDIINNSSKEYIKNYYNYCTNYSYHAKHLFSYINSEEDIKKYFKIYPSEELEKLCFESGIPLPSDIDSYKIREVLVNTNSKEMQLYYDAINKKDLGYFYCPSISNSQIVSLFSNPPTEQIFNDALFSDILFDQIFGLYDFSHVDGNKHSWNDFYKPNEKILTYIKFIKSFNFHPNLKIKNMDDINILFNDNGISDSLAFNVLKYYDLTSALKGFDRCGISNAFRNFINSFEPEKIYEICKSINIEDFGILFDNGIPNNKFYEYCLNNFYLVEKFEDELKNITFENEEAYLKALSNFTAFKILFKDDEWEKHFDCSPNKKAFIKFMKKYSNYNLFNKVCNNIDNYFDSNGPKRLLYDSILFSQFTFDRNVFELLFSDDEWKKYYNCTSYLNKYINCLIKGGFDFYDYSSMSEFYDKYDKALFDYSAFHKYFGDESYLMSYDPSPKVKAYIEFIKKDDWILKNIERQDLIKNINDIERYFDEDGPSKTLLHSEILNRKRVFFLSSAVNDYLNQKVDGAFLSFYKFGDLEFIQTEDDVRKYFDSNGPSKELFNKALFEKDFLFNKLFDAKYFDLYNVIYAETPQVLRYIEYRKKNTNITIIVNSEEDINKYFSADGYSKEFYSYIFKNNHKIFLDTFDGDLTPSAVAYKNFIQKYNLTFDFITDYDDINNYFDENGYTDNLVESISSHKEYTKQLLHDIQSNSTLIANLDFEFINVFRKYIIENYSSNIRDLESRFDYLFNNVGFMLLFSLDSDKIDKILSYSDEDLNKLFSLFERDKQVVDNPTDIFFTSMFYKKFEIEHYDIKNIFVIMSNLINDLSFEEINQCFIEGDIDNHTPDLDKFIYYFTLITNQLDYDDEAVANFANIVLNLKKNASKENLDAFHYVCMAFLDSYRGDYINENIKKLSLKIQYNSDDAIKKLNEHYFNTIDYETFKNMLETLKTSIKDYDNLKGHIDTLKMKKEEFDMLLNLTKEEFDLIIDAKRNRKAPSDGKKFGLFNRFISAYSTFAFDNSLVGEYLLNSLSVEKEYLLPLEKIDLIPLLKDLNIDIFLNTVCKDEELYVVLQKIIKTYCIGRLPSMFTKQLESEEFNRNALYGNINDVGQFITRFEELHQKKINDDRAKNRIADGNDWPFMTFISYSSYANSDIPEIRRLLGEDAYSTFVLNKNPYSGDLGVKDRLDKLMIIIDYLYTLDKVTIPSCDEVIENNNKTKRINFIVGNRTNPANICLGEKTGACMRIGSAGETLFAKCITDPNWFHIRLEDPDTHEFISRVSGFRNGNTLFLNQLRCVPEDCKYTNEDLQEFIKIFAERIIEETKNSKYPIENVFINGGYGMETSSLPKINEFNDKKTYNEAAGYNLKGFEAFCRNGTEFIYYDPAQILLATTEEGVKTESGHAPVILGPQNTEYYDCARDKIYGLSLDEMDIQKHKFVEVSKKELLEKVNRVFTMKQKLLGNDNSKQVKDDETFVHKNKIIVDNVIDGYASSDWYVYIDSNYVIHADFISTLKINDKDIPYNQKDKAQQEMEYCKQLLIKKYDLSNEVKYGF